MTNLFLCSSTFIYPIVPYAAAFLQVFHLSAWFAKLAEFDNRSIKVFRIEFIYIKAIDYNTYCYTF